MTNDVAKLTPASVPQFTPDQLKLITNTIAKNATPDELQLFLYRCKNMGLDPLKPGQIHFIKYNVNSPGTIVVGIEGFRSIAQRTGKLSGVKRGVLKDEKGKLLAGWAEVYRSDWKECAREEVPFGEYYKPGKNQPGPWDKMPETMIKKVAEAAALRMAFPDDLGGVYESAEMDQADNQPPRVYPSQPQPGDGAPSAGVAPSKFMIEKGAFAKRSPQDLSQAELQKEVDRLLSLPNPTIEEQQYLDRAETLLESYRQMDPEDDAKELPYREKPKCQCGSGLVLSPKKHVYYCANFKASGKHCSAIPQAEYEAI